METSILGFNSTKKIKILNSFTALQILKLFYNKKNNQESRIFHIDKEKKRHTI
jgi:hypothetical protein